MKSNISSIPKFDCEATESIGVAKAGYWLSGEVDIGGDDDEDDASDVGGMVFSVDGVGTLVSFGTALSIFSTTCCSRAEM